MIHDDMNDSLDGFFSDAGLQRATPEEMAAKADLPNIADALHYEPCRKCGGSGYFRSYTGRTVGRCFTCKGEGKLGYKTPTAVREARRESFAAKRDRLEQEWNEANPIESAWIARRRDRFDFAANMGDAVRKYGHLTENQLAAVRRLIQKDADREAAAAAEKVARVASAPEISVGAIEASFARAKEAGLKSPTLRLAEFKFKPAKAHSVNAGAIYVTESDVYLGKIVAGKFQRSRDCDMATEARIVEVASDPATAAVAYGRKYGICGCCGRELTDPASVAAGIGPVCATKFFG